MTNVELARKVFETELNEINEVSQRLDSNFENIIDEVLRLKRRLVIYGMGKSGIIGRKISATLSSVGTLPLLEIIRILGLENKTRIY